MLIKLISLSIISVLFITETDNKVTTINPPTNFQITNATSVGQNPEMTWTASPGATEFKVYRKRVGFDLGYVHIATVTTESFTDLCSDITDGHGPGDEDVFWYRVTAVGGTTESNPSNAASVYGESAGGPGCSL